MDGDGSGYPLFITRDSETTERIELGAPFRFGFVTGEAHGREEQEKDEGDSRANWVPRSES